MADIHVHIVEGEETIYPEERIPELLKQGTLTPETYYWREGMPQWRRLSSFKPSVQAVVPERRSGLLPDPAERPVRAERDQPAVSERASGGSSGSRRFRFRRKPELITRIVQALLALTLLITLAELALALPGLGSGNSRSEQREMLGWIGLAANVVLVIPYCLWVYRMNLNCHGFSSVVPFTPKWAVGCHFVPVMNLVRPFQAMQQIWKVSSNPRSWQNDSASLLVSFWWAFFLLTIVVAESSFLVTDMAKTPADFHTATLVFIGLKVVQAIWYVLFLAMAGLILGKQVHLVKSQSASKAKPGGKLLPGPNAHVIHPR
jgi:hypothetical protein